MRGHYGPNFPSEEMVRTPQHLLPYLPYCLSSSTWSSYRTAHRMFHKFLRVEGRTQSFPVSFYILTQFVVYMFEVRRVKLGTIGQYLSGLRFIHEYSGYPTAVFDDPRIIKLKQGMLNIQRMQLKASTDRRVFTFECLQILNYELSLMSQYGYVDKQTIWCAILLAFWGSMRFGELLPGSHGVVEIKMLKWSRVRYVTKNHLAIFVALPKQDKKSVGIVKHIYNYKPDPLFCPIWNLRHLYELKSQVRPVKGHHKVFELPSGKLLRMYAIRRILRATDKYFPPGTGKLTCHSLRAGLASFVSNFPSDFTEQDIKKLGKWNTGVHEVYSRIHGVGEKKTHRKIVRRLQAPATAHRQEAPRKRSKKKKKKSRSSSH